MQVERLLGGKEGKGGGGGVWRVEGCKGLLERNLLREVLSRLQEVAASLEALNPRRDGVVCPCGCLAVELSVCDRGRFPRGRGVVAPLLVEERSPRVVAPPGTLDLKHGLVNRLPVDVQDVV